ncbi:peptide chain release factor 2 [Enterobacteriaceae endosymbiont of Macroplea mutica]|uniref:peptide chain release factor 2 n=1 Tax=Enterobacteriaceae endosymbiont of Macroplea mutica TaxID=2675791 RepID=UPI0014499B6A|nr:peptide chain release factor 2 [Enterobacteriaceae endosymbiont of Macroplea mutica]QJC31225.1 peptide chain release factor 2 [Enterobacteriaceae endosymbiont of Macroplea mutica]
MCEIYLIQKKLKDIQKRNNFIRSIFNYSKYQKQILDINNTLANPDNWNNFTLIYKLKKKKSKIDHILFLLNNIQQELIDMDELIKLAIETNDNIIIKELIKILNNLKKQINYLEFTKLFNKKNDEKDCFIDIKAGSGGIESQDWAQIIMKMYLKWAENKKFKTIITEETTGELDSSIKSATIHIKGNYAFGWLRTENGIHRLVRKSPFNSSHRRHTSFVSTFVYPDIEQNMNVFIKMDDLRIDVYRASGSGGQHVNRTESAVRITHLPTGIVTQCQNNRSQHQNKQQAIKQIKSKLYKLQYFIQKQTQKKIEKNKLDISWGYQIRSYILDDSRIKDVRTGIIVNNIQSVLEDGNLDTFIKASLKLGL